MIKIPLVINNRNRFTYLKAMIDWFKPDRMAEIIILDNDSTYEPLLDYYKTLDCQVVKLGKNLGHTALYSWNGHHNFKSKNFIYTDPDLLPTETCPKNIIPYLMYLKHEHFFSNKIGIMLETTDLPDHYKYKKDVLELTKHYCHNRLKTCFISHVDTTFAMYDIDNVAGKEHFLGNCLLTDRPYVMRHLPWYEDSNNLSEEQVYYAAHADATFTNFSNKVVTVGQWTRLTRKDLIDEGKIKV
jgi:hypothetical protein